MAESCFRSEDEQIRSLLDDPEYPFVKTEDPIFYNHEYEKNLLMSYDLDLGESCGSDSEAVNHQYNWYSEKETSHLTSVPVNLTTSGPLIKVEPANSLSDRRALKVSPVVDFSTYQSSKRGRPSKQTSNSKMANYARNYREMKKNQLATAEVHLKELQEEIRLLREENRRMQVALEDANTEISHLRTVIDEDSSLANVVSRMNDRCSFPILRSSTASVCLHVGENGTTVEVCKTCADNSKMHLQQKYKLDSIKIDPDLELFNGDFSSIEQFIS
ncbi:unnamed protein product [Caenorhabditis auriculariae]|uniref:BZIP domain-containing protein n=1 Tax=Caenorhabditis auriculariae TaxID=2777116 RepID=A0A8S1HJX5_9PELO|nr:unnamed protein product [Caenorhabditis auriculariae]